MGWLSKTWKKVSKFTPMGLLGNPGDMLGSANTLLGDAMGWDAAAAAKQANEDRYKLALKLFDQEAPRIQQGFQQQRKHLGQALDTTRKGGQAALGELAMMGSRGRQDAQDAGARAAGQGTMALIGGGLGTSTRLAGLARGAASDTARNMQSVNESLAGARAGLQQDQASRIAQLQSIIGSSHVNQASALSQWRLSKINAIQNRQDVAGPGWLPQTLDVAKSIISLGK